MNTIHDLPDYFNNFLYFSQIKMGSLAITISKTISLWMKMYDIKLDAA